MRSSMRADINAVLAIAFGAVVSLGLTAAFLADSSEGRLRMEVRASEARENRVSLPYGYQALSVRVEPGPETSGRLRPGTSVDVLVTHDEGAEGASTETSELILQDVQVLGTSRQLSRRENEESTRLTFFTLMVTHEQADRLTMAARDRRVHVRSAACASRTPELEAFCR